jgi:hypothetical protein
MTSTLSEKDPTRILMICMACLLMSTLRMVVLNPLASASLQWSDVPKTIFYWTSNGTNFLGLCTEEICLGVLLRDFRQNVRHQLDNVFCCGRFCCNKKMVCVDSTQTTMKVSVMRTVKVNNLV